MRSSIALRRPVQTTTLDMSGTNIPTGSYATLLAKASNKFGCSAVEIFNPSGSPMILALGDAGLEVVQPYTILPGGTTGFLALEIPANTRVALKAYDAAVTSGRFVLNQFA